MIRKCLNRKLGGENEMERGSERVRRDGEREGERISCMEAQGQFRAAVSFQGHVSVLWY